MTQHLAHAQKKECYSIKKKQQTIHFIVYLFHIYYSPCSSFEHNKHHSLTRPMSIDNNTTIV